jgi:hypothetical protein
MELDNHNPLTALARVRYNFGKQRRPLDPLCSVHMHMCSRRLDAPEAS